MIVEVAKNAGFCFGVKRAVDLVFGEAKKQDGPVYTYGPIINNEEVVKELEDYDVRVIKQVEEVQSLEEGKIIIRSHGVSREIQERLNDSKLEVIDATCPFVKRIHKYVEEYSKKGYTIIIIGNKEHPEVQGICGWSFSQKTIVINSEEEAAGLELDLNESVCIVAQTTYNNIKFKELVEIITKKGYDISVINTICNATHERQTEAVALAKKSDAVIVIGSLTSSNTGKLHEICKEECANTYYIQTIDDLDIDKIHEFHSVGITAGASTPNKIIEEVQTYVRNEF